MTEAQQKQATLQECNRQMRAIGATEKQVVQLKGPAGIISVPRSEVDLFTRQGYVPVEAPAGTKEEDGSNAGGQNNSGNGGAAFEYKGKKYTADEVLALRDKAGIAKTVKKPETIIGKLVELDFDPDAE